MTSKVASSCEPRTVHPWGKPSQEKNPRRPERCSVDEADASFYGLQVSSVPFRPSGLCLVVSSSETNRQGPVVFRAAAGAAERKRVLWAVHDCRGRSCSSRAAGKGSGPCGARASRSGAQEGPESRAAVSCWCCSGRQSCRGRSRQR